MKSFEELSLPAPLKDALIKMQFSTPTPIQAQAIPFALAGEDILGSAQTGTGKTAAFCIPILAQMLNDENNKSQALIVAPTRELAQQIEDVVKALTQCMPGFRTALVVGGLSMFAQVKNLRAYPRIIVATPGRAIDHLKRGSMRLDQTRFFVLDEVDRMLDIGFAPQLLEILKYLPQKRQTFFFSATLPAEIERIAKRFAPNPKRVSVGQESQPVEWIAQRVIQMSPSEKVPALLDEINKSKGAVIVFVRTQRRCERLASELGEFGVDVALVHGGRSQGQRNSAMKAFRAGDAKILVATDVAARGIDISAVERVVNFDVPQFPEDYVHRIGRTGRAGLSGEAVSFVASEERGAWNQIAKFLEKKKAKAPAMETRKASMPMAKPEKNFAPSAEEYSGGEGAPMEYSAPRREKSFERRERSERSFGRPNRGGFRSAGRSGEQSRTRKWGAAPAGEKNHRDEGRGVPSGRWKATRPAGARKPFENKPADNERRSYDEREPMFHKKSNPSFESRSPKSFGDRKPHRDAPRFPRKDRSFSREKQF